MTNTSMPRLLLALSTLALAGFASAAQADAAANIFTTAELRSARASAHVSAPDGQPAIYAHYSGDANLSADVDHPHLGTAVSFDSGPQTMIGGLRFYLHSRSDHVYDRIRVLVKFWNAHDAASNPVFSSAPPASTVAIDLTGPFNLLANTAYAADATLPKAVWLDTWESTGLSMHVLSSSNGGELGQNDDLLPAFDANASATTGTALASYGEVGGLRDDFNFSSSDSYPHALAIQLYGAARPLVECGAWGRYVSRSIEEFDDESAFSTRWALDPRGGTATFGTAGDFTLAAPNGASTFPYVTSRGSPLPPTGEFSVRWLARYEAAAPAGTGSLVISAGLPQAGTGDDLLPRAAWVWQDTSQGFHVKAKTDFDVQNPAPVYQEGAAADDVTHDIEYCWLDSSIEVWVDGVRVAQQARDADVPRPDSLWFGNHTNTGATNWNDVRLYRVHVRTPYTDDIFGNGFD